MDHLFASVVKVTEMRLTPQPGGRMRMERVVVPGLAKMKCRIDLQFLRPGKDTPPAVVAGSIPDREGIMFCRYTPKLMAGMQIETIPDARGNEVVKGVFEIKEIPDVAVGFGSAHHIEVKVIESVQKTVPFPDIESGITGVMPNAAPTPDGVEFPDVDNP